jgi:hypothetical protein
MAWGVPKIGALATPVASGDLTLAEPAGIAQGDLMVACISYRSNAAFTVPGDWNLVATQQSSGDTDATNGIASGLMMWTVRGGSAPTLTFTRTAGDVATGRIIAYTGGHPSAPYDTGSANTLGANSATVTTGTITTAEAGELLVAMTSAGDNLTASAFDAATDPTTASGATDTTTAPTAGTWIERSDDGTGTGADNALAIADAIRATAGATGTIQATISASARHVMIVGAFKLGAPLTVTPALGTATWAGFAPTFPSALTAELREGGVLRATRTWTPTEALATNTITLDAGEKASIVNWSDVELWLIPQGIGAIRVTRVHGETPEADTAVRPGLGTATWAGFAPTIGLPITVSPGLGDATWAGFAPSLSFPATVTPGLGDAAWAGFAPTIGLPVTVAPGLGDATWAGFAPTVVSPITVAPGAGDATWAGFAPTIGLPLAVSPGLGEAAWAGFAPTIGTPLTVAPGLGDATWAGFAPTLVTEAGGITVEPGVGSATWAGFAPTIGLPVTVSPGLGTATWAGFAPSLPASLTVELRESGTLRVTRYFEPLEHVDDPGNRWEMLLTDEEKASITNWDNVEAWLIATGGSRAIRVTRFRVFVGDDGVTVTPGLGTATWAGFAPTITAPLTVTPGVGSGTWAGFAPVVGSATTVQPGVGAATWVGFAPTITAPLTVSPGRGLGTWAGFAPTAGTPGEATPTPTPGGGRGRSTPAKRWIHTTVETEDAAIEQAFAQEERVRAKAIRTVEIEVAKLADPPPAPERRARRAPQVPVITRAMLSDLRARRVAEEDEEEAMLKMLMPLMGGL